MDKACVFVDCPLRNTAGERVYGAMRWWKNSRNERVNFVGAQLRPDPQYDRNISAKTYGIIDVTRQDFLGTHDSQKYSTEMQQKNRAMMAGKGIIQVRNHESPVQQ